MLNLTISHHIFLTDEERTNLLCGTTIETTGVSVPVWFYENTTSEPAKEIFCKYILTNKVEDYPVVVLANGYKINIPKLAEEPIVEFPKEYDDMTQNNRFEWNSKNSISISNKISRLKTGHTETIRCYHRVTEENKRINIIHLIEISTKDTLLKSL